MFAIAWHYACGEMMLADAATHWLGSGCLSNLVYASRSGLLFDCGGNGGILLNWVFWLLNMRIVV